jgi:tetratricopeptide (TPR) repeat protein
MRLRKTGWTLCVLMMAAAGCGQKYKVNLSYDLPAEVEVSQSIRNLAVAEFSGPDREDRRWGQRVADKLVASLTEGNRTQQRYTIVDRRKLGSILDERDLQLAQGDPDAAARIGKVAKADAIIYGTVNVESNRSTKRRATFDPSTQRPTFREEEVLSVTAAVSFQMVRVSDSQAIIAEDTRAQYRSDQEDDEGGMGSKLAGAMGLGGADQSKNPDQIAEDLLDQCVHEFTATISPHRVNVTVALEKGENKDLVERANQLASRGSYTEAIQLYSDALTGHPRDHQTMFNKAVSHEALGQYAQAEALYDQAYKLKSQVKYLDGRQRARRALQAAETAN